MQGLNAPDGILMLLAFRERSLEWFCAETIRSIVNRETLRHGEAMQWQNYRGFQLGMLAEAATELSATEFARHLRNCLRKKTARRTGDVEFLKSTKHLLAHLDQHICSRDNPEQSKEPVYSLPNGKLRQRYTSGTFDDLGIVRQDFVKYFKYFCQTDEAPIQSARKGPPPLVLMRCRALTEQKTSFHCLNIAEARLAENSKARAARTKDATRRGPTTPVDLMCASILLWSGEYVEAPRGRYSSQAVALRDRILDFLGGDRQNDAIPERHVRILCAFMDRAPIDLLAKSYAVLNGYNPLPKGGLAELTFRLLCYTLERLHENRKSTSINEKDLIKNRAELLETRIIHVISTEWKIKICGIDVPSHFEYPQDFFVANTHAFRLRNRGGVISKMAKMFLHYAEQLSQRVRWEIERILPSSGSDLDFLRNLPLKTYQKLELDDQTAPEMVQFLSNVSRAREVFGRVGWKTAGGASRTQSAGRELAKHRRKNGHF